MRVRTWETGNARDSRWRLSLNDVQILTGNEEQQTVVYPIPFPKRKSAGQFPSVSHQGPKMNLVSSFSWHVNRTISG